MNLDKLNEAIAHIEAHPERHDQSVWFARTSCGTTACLAGTVVSLNGWTRVWRSDWAYSSNFVANGNLRGYVPAVAAEILGLGAEDADAFFRGARDLEKIKAIRDAIVAGKPGWSALDDSEVTT